MRRKRNPPAPAGLFRGAELSRLGTLLVMLVLMWMLYRQAADPATWRWLADDPQEVAVEVRPAHNPILPVAAPAWEETIVPGPGGEDPEEQDAAREEFQAVADRAPLDAVEMPAYWRLMRWSRTQSFEDLEKQAQRDVMFTRLWEQPEKFRGKLIRLRLHVRQTLSHDDVPQNSAHVKHVYEARGATDESKSFPYVVVFSELPPEMPLGHDVHEEAVFVGYFLKQWSYQAYNVQRAAPLLVGRLRWQENTARTALARRDGGLFWLTVAGGGVVLLCIVASWMLKSRARRMSAGGSLTPAEDLAASRWLERMQEVESSRPTSQ